ncbi:MAG TPA: ABC transporter permease [Thermomicrobiales bacterium]|nr:ABC transporter permease [Thermomicrobiales bacterium]
MSGLLLAAILDIRSKPWRTFAAIAGMIAAVIAVILVDAASVLSHRANDEYLARHFGLPITMSVFSSAGKMSDTDAARVDQVLAENGFSTVSRVLPVPMVPVVGGYRLPVGGIVVSSAYRDIRIVDLAAGSWPRSTATAQVLHVVVTSGFAQQLGMDPANAIGQTFAYAIAQPDSSPTMATTLYVAVIDAVGAETTNAFDLGMPMIVSDVPHPEFGNWFGEVSWLVRVNPGDVDFLKATLGTVTDARGQPMVAVQRVDQASELAPVLDQQNVTARIVMWVALVIGGLGILGVGLASVRERSMEFGLRRALGATRVRIFASVVAQTLLEVLLAAIIAIPVAGAVLGLSARRLVLETLPLPASTSLPVKSALLGLVSALVVGLIASCLPAMRAARLSVIQALRD